MESIYDKRNISFNYIGSMCLSRKIEHEHSRGIIFRAKSRLSLLWWWAHFNTLSTLFKPVGCAQGLLYSGTLYVWRAGLGYKRSIPHNV